MTVHFLFLPRQSVISTADTPSQGFENSTADSTTYPASTPRPRQDSNQLLTLPAPLALSRGGMTIGSVSSAGLSPSSDDAYGSDVSSIQHRLITKPSLPTDTFGEELYEAPAAYSPRPNHASIESQISRAGGGNAVLRQATAFSQYPGETHPHDTQAAYGEHVVFSAEPEEPPQGGLAYTRSRGVSLSDAGPVVGPEGVRRVARPSSRRPTSQAPPQNRYSRTSMHATLPPGAAPPSTSGNSSGY